MSDGQNTPPGDQIFQIEVTKRELDEVLRIRREEQMRQNASGGANFPALALNDTQLSSPIIDNTMSSIDWGFGLRKGSDGQGTNIDEDLIGGKGDIGASGLVERSAPRNLLFDSLCEVLRSQELRDTLCNLQGNRAQLIIDYLYTVLQEPELPEPWLRRHCLIALYKLSKSSFRYPHCYSLNEMAIGFSSSRVANGGYSDVHKGKLGENELCLKVVRLGTEWNASHMLKIYAKEAILWGQLRHPSIVPFYGLFYHDEIRRELCLVSPWIHYGDLGNYLKTHSQPRRASLSYDVVRGMGYLHDLGLIHSDLKAANVLVNDLEHALITDFGMSFIRTDKTFSNVVISRETQGGTGRYYAPELLEDDACATMASDTWALGCVLYQIMSGKRPFANLSDDMKIMKALFLGKKPGEPVPTSDTTEKIIWKEVVRCFETNPEDRPKCQEIVEKFRSTGVPCADEDAALAAALRKRRNFLQAMKMDSEKPLDIDEVRRVFRSLKSEDDRSLWNALIEVLSEILRSDTLIERVIELRGTSAQVVIDYLYAVISSLVLPEPSLRRDCAIAFSGLSTRSNLYPRCYTLQASIFPESRQLSSRTSDFYKGKFHNKELCFKLVRTVAFGRDLNKMLKIRVKEAILLEQLDHPNIAPFYGIYYPNQELEQFCLVSPWMKHGNLVQYLMNTPSAPRELLAYDVASGLSYLHERYLIHSNIKGSKILVNDIGQACITGFGCSFIHTAERFSRDIWMYGRRFTPRWAAPELLDEDECSSTASDVWALGCVFWEILTGKVPYDGLTDFRVLRAQMNGSPPGEPSADIDSSIIWKQAERCWTIEPTERPTCQDILLSFKQAGISRREGDEAQREAEQEMLKVRNALRMDPEEPVNLEAVKNVFDELRK